MASLTSVIPLLAPVLDFTPAALYERQRALVKLGLLPAPQGRGRGSGAVATAETISLLVIATLATDNLSDTDGRVKKLASARFVDPKLTKCPWTGQKNFHSALSHLLSDEEPWAEFNFVGVDVSRTEPQADISFHYGDKDNRETDLGKSSRFGAMNKSRHLRRHVTCSLEYEALEEIRAVVLGATDV